MLARGGPRASAAFTDDSRVCVSLCRIHVTFCTAAGSGITTCGGGRKTGTSGSRQSAHGTMWVPMSLDRGRESPVGAGLPLGRQKAVAHQSPSFVAAAAAACTADGRTSRARRASTHTATRSDRHSEERTAPRLATAGRRIRFIVGKLPAPASRGPLSTMPQQPRQTAGRETALASVGTARQGMMLYHCRLQSN